MNRCVKCGSAKITSVSDVVSHIHGVKVVADGLRCKSCGEEFFDEEQFDKLAQKAKNLGLWGEPLKLHRKLSKSARGTVLRIPSDIEKSLKLKGDENILISTDGKKKIVIEIE